MVVRWTHWIFLLVYAAGFRQSGSQETTAPSVIAPVQQRTYITVHRILCWIVLQRLTVNAVNGLLSDSDHCFPMYYLNGMAWHAVHVNPRI